MKFAYPEFLYALFALAIPIIIHLFNFRKFKKVYFSNVQFLKEVKQETQAKSKLKHLLILLSRILAIMFLVFAFAQPFIPANKSANKNKNNEVGIYIDNSFSMESMGKKGNLLDEAKTNAKAIINSYKSTDKFVLINNNFSAADQRSLTQEEALDKIDEIQISAKTKMLSALFSRIKTALNNAKNNNKSLYLISDFQKTVTDFKNIASDTLIDTYLIKVKANEPNNLYIDSCWFENPTHLLFQHEQLKVLIKNDSKKILTNIPVKLYINKQIMAPASVSIKANDETTITLNYQNKTHGIQQGKITIRDNPVTADDAFYFSYTNSKNINILTINGKENNTAIASIYQTDSIFHFTNINIAQLDYSQIRNSNLVIINDLDEVSSGLSTSLKAFVANGGSLLVLPSGNINFNSYQEFLSLLSVNYYTIKDTLKTKVKEINYNHAIFKTVFDGKPKHNLNLPYVNQHYQISNYTTSFKNKLLTLKDGSSFLNEYHVAKGKVYLACVGLDKKFSNFVNHALFVPIFYNIALLSQRTYPLFHIIGSKSTININKVAKDNIYHIINNNFDVIPRVKNKNNSTTIFINVGIEKAGNYVLKNSNDVLLGLSYNYNRLESQLACYTKTALQEKIRENAINAKIFVTTNNNIKSTLNEINLGTKYWKFCIILALLFLAIEILLIKIFK